MQSVYVQVKTNQDLQLEIIFSYYANIALKEMKIL